MRTPTNAGVTTIMNAGNPYLMAQCYTITLIDGTILRYANFPVDVTVNGNTYTSSGIKVERDSLSQKVGVVVDTMTMYLSALQTDLVEGIPFYSAIRLGWLDGATIDLDIAIAQNLTSGFVGTFNWFSGSISSVDTVSRNGATIQVASDSERMNIMFPRNVFQPMCGNTLYDNTCKLNRLSFQYGATLIGLGDAAGDEYQTSITSASFVGYFDQGYVKLVGGTYAGLTKTIKFSSFYAPTNSLYLYFFEPFPVTLSNQAVYIYPGCDKQQSTCSGKFNNVINFVGMPYIPTPETVV